MRMPGLMVMSFVLACPTESPQTRAAPPSGLADMDDTRYRVDLMPDDQALGGDAPLVTLVVFSGYGCPPCARLWQVMRNLVEDYGEDIRIVHRAYAVPGFAQAEQAAEAAFVAGAQDKFWPMHERLLAMPHALDRPSLRAHAQHLELDAEPFERDLEQGVHAGTILRHRRQAKELGVVGVPATFVNGLYVVGYADEAVWHELIDREIAVSRAELANGTPRAQLYARRMSQATSQSVSSSSRARKLRAELREEAPTKAVVPPRLDQRYHVAPGRYDTGSADADVVVVEFLDIKCPYCRRAWRKELEALVTAHADHVRFSMRHLPLPIHPEAQGAAIALEAAGRQHGFWAMHKALLAHEGPLGRSVFVELARELGLDPDRFVADFEDESVASAVAGDVQIAQALGVTGTPGFFVNGRYVRGYRPGELAAVIDEELTLVAQQIESGIAAGTVFEQLMADAVQPKDFPNR